jgi:hypothetical protein
MSPKKNLVAPSKPEGGTVGSFVRLPIKLKERAQMHALKNKTTLTDLIILGLEGVVGGGFPETIREFEQKLISETAKKIHNEI